MVTPEGRVVSGIGVASIDVVGTTDGDRAVSEAVPHAAASIAIVLLN